MRDLSDEQLVAVVKATNASAAFDELARRHSGALIGFIAAFGRPDIDAEDVAQNALLKAYLNIKQFEGRSAFRTWLFRIAYREFLRVVEKGARAYRTIDALEADITEDAGMTSVDTRVDITRAIAALDDHERTALLLCDVGDFTHVEAAKAMNAPLGSVKTYVRRARRRIQTILDSGTAEEATDE